MFLQKGRLEKKIPNHIYAIWVLFLVIIGLIELVTDNKNCVLFDLKNNQK